MRMRKKSMAPQATTFKPYMVMRKPVGVLKKRQKAASPVTIVCFHVFGVSGSDVEWSELCIIGSQDFLSVLLSAVKDGTGEMLGNVVARL